MPSHKPTEHGTVRRLTGAGRPRRWPGQTPVPQDPPSEGPAQGRRPGRVQGGAATSEVIHNRGS